mmetsp:Transcript_12313/g.25909  ORF Transcript_12313/g.25909 Transcript_12313/m.25909 type:complete len:218 (-) Transcript_12313:852-1505(-)
MLSRQPLLLPLPLPNLRLGGDRLRRLLELRIAKNIRVDLFHSLTRRHRIRLVRVPDHQVLLELVRRGVRPLGGIAGHDVYRLLQANPDRLLRVRNAVLLAQRLHLRLRALVRESAELRPHVVLHLVVEPAVHEVVQVAASPEVGRRCHLPHVERARVGSAAVREGVEILAGVVGGDHNERVNVRHHVGEKKADDRVLERGSRENARRAERQHGERQQ